MKTSLPFHWRLALSLSLAVVCPSQVKIQKKAMRTMFFRVLAVLALTGWAVGNLQAQYIFDHVGGGATGSVTPNGPGSITLEGGGDDIWDTSDSFDFYHKTLSGDFDVRVRVESLEPTARSTKAGLMVRETLAGSSRMGFARVTPAQVPTPSGGDGAGNSCFAYRTGITDPPFHGRHEDGCAANPSFFPNNWVRLVRSGSHLLGYRSTNGTAWTLMGDQDAVGWEGGAFPAAIQVGLAVSRHSGPDPLAIAQFRNLANVSEDPTTIVSNPTNTTVLENQPATFSVDVAGGYDVFTFQWRENGVNISGATSRIYTTPPRALTDTGKQYRAVVTSTLNGSSATSSAGVLTVSSSPALLNVSTREQPNQVLFLFSEPVSAATALDVANYDIPGVNLLSAAYGDNNSTVVITTDPLVLGTTYSANVFNVEDLAGNVIDPNPSFGSFSHPGDGHFSSDFDSGLPARTSVYGSAIVNPTAGVGGSGVMSLTPNANGAEGFWLIEDINNGKPVEQLDVTFQVRVGGSSCCGAANNPAPADGFAFSFAGNLPNGIPGPALACCGAEDGGGNGLVVSFDTWDNGGADTAPSVDVIYRNEIKATRSFAGVREGGRAPTTSIPTDPATTRPLHFITDHPGGVNFPVAPNFVNVRIRLELDGTIDVWYKDVQMLNNVQTSYVPQAGRFGFGGRTGSANETHYIDNLTIKTYGNLGPVAFLIQPQSQTVNENATVSFRGSADGSPAISYQWKANGVDIPGATGPLYTTVASLDKHGTVYTVVARNDFSQATSDPATLSVCPVAPREIVSSLNDSGANSLRAAISNSCDRIRIIFAPTLRGKIRLTSGELFINKPLTIEGPGAAQLAISGNTNSRVFHIGPQGNVDISGLTITEGQVVGTTGANGVNPGDPGAPGGSGFGGGIYNNGDLTLLNCWIVGSIAKGGVGGGGGGDTFELQAGNGGVGGMGAGGGIYNNNLLTLVNCTASGNSTVGGLGGSGANALNYFYGDGGGGGTGGLGTGGGVCNNGIVNVTNCTLSGNASSGGTGGVGGNAHAQGDAGGGGAGGTGTGGGLASLNNLHLSSCTLSLNSLGAGAGGLGGSGSFGGGSAGSPGTTQAGGLQSTTTANLIQNSLIADNSAATLPDCKGSFTSLGFNLVGITNGGSGFTAVGDQAGSLASPINPGLGPLQNNGGPTPTMALLPGSPAIDHGKSSGLTTDQRGRARPFDWPAVANASGGDGSDIGAFERGPPGLSITRAGSQVILSWPASELVFRLQSADTLPAGNTWTIVSGNPVLSGGIYQMTKTISGARQFYRLINP